MEIVAHYLHSTLWQGQDAEGRRVYAVSRRWLDEDSDKPGFSITYYLNQALAWCHEIDRMVEADGL